MTNIRKNTKCLTTVAVTSATLEQIRQDAATRNIPNHEVVRQAMLAYSKKAQATAATDGQREESINEILRRIDKSLDKLSHRDDIAIGFIKTQEENLLKPIHSKVLFCKDLLEQILTSLKGL